jgi:TonB family protein
MEFSRIVLLLGLLGGAALAQEPQFEKRAVELVQRTPVSTLEESMPRRPFAEWFKELVGPQAGVIWQLSECEQAAGVQGPRSDQPACVETNAVLPDGRKVIVRVAVGTFRKGITGDPGFFYAIIEQRNQFLLLNRLHDLPAKIRLPGKLEPERTIASTSSSIPAPPAMEIPPPLDQPKAETKAEDAPPPPPVPARSGEGSAPGDSPAKESGALPEVSMNESKKNEIRRVSAGALMGSVVKEVGPVYPEAAKRFNAWGDVQVLVMISDQGKVIDARAVSGHLLLRKAAVAAARQWQFAPSKLNGEPVSVEGVITFVFPRP